MTLSPIRRQVLAGLAGAIVFLGLYFGVALAWWAALFAGLAVYTAIMLLIETPPAAQALEGLDTQNEEELRAAINLLTDAASRLRRAALKARGPEKQTFKRMAELIEAIRGHHLADERDFRHTRGFINITLDRMVGSVEGFVDLDGKARGENRQRLDTLRERIEGFVPVLERVDQACLENDFLALEVEVEVLGDQLARKI